MGASCSSQRVQNSVYDGNNNSNTNNNNSKSNNKNKSVTNNSKQGNVTFSSKYVKGGELGRGGYSVVFSATLRNNNNNGKHQTFAVKEIMRSILKPDDEIGLQQEIEILRSLKHSHIVQFVDFFEEKDKYYVVLELLEGGELFDRIVQKSCYSEKEARDLVFVLLNAIKYIHDNDIVHRDLKPENLLMASKFDDAEVKIADFGFAKRATGLTLSTQCGSPGYVAPEILENKKYGKPADMWSLGVITYILLGGYPPFHDDKDQAALFRKIKKGVYEFHDDYWSHVSAEAKDLISLLLTVNQQQRITVDQALQHSWIKRSDSELAARNLDSNLKEFKKFYATRKFRAAAKAIIAVRRMSRSFSTSSNSGNNKNSDNGDNNNNENNAEKEEEKRRASSVAELTNHD